MFEDSTFESTGRIKTRSRRWMLAALGLNGSILAALVLIPLIHPDALRYVDPVTVITVPQLAPAEPPRPQPMHSTSSASGPEFVAPTTVPPQLPRLRGTDGPPPTGDDISLAPAGNGIPDGTGGVFSGSSPTPVVHEAPRGPIRISSSSVGTPLQRTVPVYPPMALATHTEGTVMLQAVISKEGRIENLRVVSGPAMLQQAAMNAVSQWRYRPYLLNGEPIEVETTVSVVFSQGR